MAKSSTPLQLLRSIVAGKRPDPTRLLPGQPTVNTNYTDPGFYFADSTNSELIKIGPCGVGVIPPNFGATAPGAVGNTKGELWMDTRTIAPVLAGNFLIGVNYTIATLGTTDFTAIGAGSNTVGVSFVATGPGSGTGTARYTGIVQLGPVLRVWDPISNQWLPCSPQAVGGAVTSPIAPDVNLYPDNTFWWNSTNGLLYVLYNDGNSRQWVQVASSLSPV